MRAQANTKKATITAIQKAMFGHAKLNQPKVKCDAAGCVMIASFSMPFLFLSREILENKELSADECLTRPEAVRTAIVL
jgi:hypothetical protein